MDEILPLETDHLVDLDTPSGDEYVAGGLNILSDESFFVKNAQEEKVEHIYNQNEFSEDYGFCLCTMYGPITTLSCVLGREITKEERLELVKLRVAEKDFKREMGGYVTNGVDVIRRWWNAKNPDDQIVTFLISNTEAIRKDFFVKGFPLVSSFKGNREYSVDSYDGKLDNIDYWNYKGKTWGHCLTYFQNRKIDNYNREYQFKNIDDYYTLLSHGIEGRSSFAMFRISDLNETGKTYLTAMKKGLWNGERPDDMITRFEASRIAIKMCGNTIMELQIWNMQNPDKNASKYEVSCMLQRGSKGTIKSYTGTDRNQEMTRSEAILMAMGKL